MIELQETNETYRRYFVKIRIREASIPALITLAVFLGVLALKGIFPFGPGRIDYYDMGQTNAPLYYHIWDFLHGRSGLFYTWFIDQGQNLSMGSSIQWNISVFNLFFLLIPRKMVMQSLSLFMGLHLFFMSFNMDLLLQKIVPEKKEGAPSRILMSISYGLCGYTLTHYTIPTYLDTAALIPLYLLTLAEVLRPGTSEKNEKGILSKNRRDVLIYALATGYMTALSYYLAYMDLIFILVISGTYIFLLIPKKTDTGDITRGHARIGLVCLHACTGCHADEPFLAFPVQSRKDSSRYHQGDPLGYRCRYVLHKVVGTGGLSFSLCCDRHRCIEIP